LRSNVVTLFDEAPEPKAETRFEEVWKLWPNKAKKPLAKARYEAILRGPFKTRTMDKDSGQFVDIEVTGTEDEMVAGIKAYLAAQVDKKTYRMKDDGKYIPHLSTFLNQGRFADLL
jgi:hypothetical protein